jgi:hypothetical protein
MSYIQNITDGQKMNGSDEQDMLLSTEICWVVQALPRLLWT